MTPEPDDWTNWSSLARARVSEVRSPRDAESVADAVRAARAAGRRVKMVGTGHSFTDVSAPVDVMLRPDRMRGILEIDRTRMLVRARAGTRLADLNAALEAAGLSLHNMGDIAEQTLAGAISTGTHGSGGLAAGLGAQVAALTLVTGTGEVLSVDAEQHPDVFAAARVGLGSLGVLCDITFRVEPLFVLEATERRQSWAALVSEFDAWADSADHTDVYWFPHTDHVHLKQNRRVGLAADGAVGRQAPSLLERWWNDEAMANGAFGVLSLATSRVPALTPRVNSVVGRLVADRTYRDVAHRVFTSPRRVRFKEMEYAVPRAALVGALTECRRVMEAAGHVANFPVEIRTAPADDIALSTAQGRDVAYLAFHTHVRAPHAAYFAAVEKVLLDHAGRPHWGKLHSLDAAGLEPRYERFGEFVALRDRLDPDRVFTNPYLDRVLG